MKKALSAVVVSMIAVSALAQDYSYITPNATYQPRSFGEMLLEAQVEFYRQQQLLNEFKEYQDEAYRCYNKGDYTGFIDYSDYALSTGYCTGQLYYDRGVVFEMYNEYRKAKREYKKAIRAGHSSAQDAYQQCKAHQKAWRKSR